MIPIPPLKSQKALGIFEDSFQIKGAFLSSSPGKIEVEALLSFPKEEREAFFKEVHHLLQKHPDLLLISAVSSEKITVREVSIALGDVEAARNAIPFQLEPLLPYPIDEALYHPSLIEKKEGECLFAISTTKKLFAEQALEPFEFSNLPCELITPAQNALASLFSTHPLTFLVFIKDTTTCLLVKNGTPIASRTFPTPSEQELNLELSRTFDAMTQKLPKNQTPEVIYLNGVCEGLPGKAFSFSEIFTSSYSEEELEDEALPLAIAFCALEASQASPFLFLSDTPSKGQLNRMKNKLLPTIALYLLLLLSFWLAATQPARNAKSNAEELFRDLAIEVSREDEGEEVLTLTPYPENLIEEAESFRGKIRAEQFPYPLTAVTPTISQTLAFLSSHPQAVTPSGEKLIEIFSFRYAMISQPTQTRPKDPYKIKVDLEFTSKAPKNAREFYEALQEKNPLIDSKSPIEWSPRKDSYKISFILQDHTPYTK